MLPDPEALADVVIQTVETILGPVLERLAVAETKLTALDSRVQDDALPKELGTLRERVAIVETRPSVPPAGPAVVDLVERVTSLEHTVRDRVAKEVGDLRERAAVLETRAPVPGPAGQDGVNGKNGADGFGFEDLDVSLSGDRTLVFRFARGDQEKTFRVDVGWPVYQKNWIQGKAYVPGDVVTWDGSQWQCLEPTDADIPGLSKAWYRSVTKGRAGAPGRDGKDWTPPPVVSVGRAQ